MVKPNFEKINELFKDLPKIPSVKETPEIKVAKYRPDMFLRFDASPRLKSGDSMFAHWNS